MGTGFGSSYDEWILCRDGNCDSQECDLKQRDSIARPVLTSRPTRPRVAISIIVQAGQVRLNSASQVHFKGLFTSLVENMNWNNSGGVFEGLVVERDWKATKGKGCDIGYALTASSCEGANSVEACTVTALDAITAFAVPNPNFSSQSRRFFRVRMPVELPLRADHSA